MPPMPTVPGAESREPGQDRFNGDPQCRRPAPFSAQTAVEVEVNAFRAKNQTAATLISAGGIVPTKLWSPRSE